MLDSLNMSIMRRSLKISLKYKINEIICIIFRNFTSWN